MYAQFFGQNFWSVDKVIHFYFPSSLDHERIEMSARKKRIKYLLDFWRFCRNSMREIYGSHCRYIYPVRASNVIEPNRIEIETPLTDSTFLVQDQKWNQNFFIIPARLVIECKKDAFNGFAITIEYFSHGKSCPKRKKIATWKCSLIIFNSKHSGLFSLALEIKSE